MNYDCPQDCSWFPFNDEPLKFGKPSVPRLGCPFVVMPFESSDKKWHMFVHSIFGIHHYVSTTGTDWKYYNFVVFKGQYPYVFSEGKKYYLIYTVSNKKTKTSVVEIRESDDLYSWSKPSAVFEAEELIMPQLFIVNGKYRLYFGSNAVRLPGSRQKVASHFSCIQSNLLYGPFNHVNDIDTGCGNIRFVFCEDCFYGFKCAVYLDEETKETKTEISILKGEDGLDFHKTDNKHILVQADNGWASGYLVNCDIHFSREENCWFCFYNSSNSDNLFSGESVGLLIGALPPDKRKTTESKRRGFFRR